MEKFQQSTEANYIISLLCKGGSYNLFFRGYCTSNGKQTLKFTSNVEDAFRMTLQNARMRVGSFHRFSGRVEEVDYNNNRVAVVG